MGFALNTATWSQAHKMKQGTVEQVPHNSVKQHNTEMLLSSK